MRAHLKSDEVAKAAAVICHFFTYLHTLTLKNILLVYVKKAVMCGLYASAMVCSIDVSSNGIIALAFATSVIHNLHTVIGTCA